MELQQNSGKIQTLAAVQEGNKTSSRFCALNSIEGGASGAVESSDAGSIGEHGGQSLVGSEASEANASEPPRPPMHASQWLRGLELYQPFTSEASKLPSLGVPGPRGSKPQSFKASHASQRPRSSQPRATEALLGFAPPPTRQSA